MAIRNFTIPSGVAVLMLFLLAAGCQTFSPASPEASLRKRVMEMMTARVNQNWTKVYSYLDPGLLVTGGLAAFQLLFAVVGSHYVGLGGVAIESRS